MSYTKGELVQAALTQIGIADHEFDIAPEEITTGVRIMDAMVGQWSAKGVKISYPLPGTSEGSAADADSGIPDSAWEAVIYNLALRLAPTYGKQVSQDVKIIAKSAWNTLLSFSARPDQSQLNQMPKGAGYKSVNDPFTPVPGNPYLDVVDEDVDLSGGFDGGA